MRDENTLTQRPPGRVDAAELRPREPSGDPAITASAEDPRLLQAILAHVSEGAALTEPNTGRILYTTPSLDRKFGYDPDELVGQHASVLNAPGTARDTYERIVEGLDKTGAWQGEIHNKRKDGSCFWTWLDVFTFEHSSYGPVWVSVQKDLTEIRRTQEELRKFGHAIRMSVDGINFLDMSGHFVYCNEASHEMYGYEPRGLVGLHLDDVSTEPGHGREVILPALMANSFWQDECEQLRKDGSAFMAHVTLSLIEDHDGTRIGIQGVVRDVTEVRQLKGDFNALVKTLPHGIQLTDASARIIFANAALHEMFECEEGELIGRSLLDFVPSDRRQEKAERLKRLGRETPAPVSRFEQKVTKSGKVIDVRIDWGYRADADGAFAGFASLLTDITASTDVEAALRKTQESFDLAVRGSSDGLWDWPDLERNERWWSPRIYELLGYEDGEIELTDAGFLDLMPAEDQERVDRALQAHLEDNVPYEVEYRLRTKSGEYRWFRGRGQALRDADGWPTRMSGSVSDIHERQVATKELEARLSFQRMVSDVSTTFAKAPTAQLGEAIVRSLEFLGEFLGADRCALVHLSHDDSMLDGTYTWIRGEETTGFSAVPREGLRGFPEILSLLQRGDVHYFTEEDEIPTEWKNFRRFVEENDMKSGLAMPLFVGENLLGSVAAFSLEGSPTWPSVLMERDNIVGQLFANVLGNLEWDAGVRRLGEELTHVTRVAAMGELTASLAHELNQPLEAIAGNAVAAGHFLRGHPTNPDEAHAALADISEEARRAGEVIRRMRALLEKGEHERSPLCMNDLAEEVVALLQNEANLRNTWFELDLAPDLPLVEGDRIQLQQVLMNLLMNSIDATRDDGASPHKVTIRTFGRGNKESEVAVLDDGIRLDASFVESIFDPFFTTKPNGLGMGLSISRSIIESHSGRLWVERDLDSGAAFHFVLPNLN